MTRQFVPGRLYRLASGHECLIMIIASQWELAWCAGDVVVFALVLEDDRWHIESVMIGKTFWTEATS